MIVSCTEVVCRQCLEKNILRCGSALNADRCIGSKAIINSHWPLQFPRWRMVVVGVVALSYTMTTMANIAMKATRLTWKPKSSRALDAQGGRRDHARNQILVLLPIGAIARNWASIQPYAERVGCELWNQQSVRNTDYVLSTWLASVLRDAVWQLIQRQLTNAFTGPETAPASDA